MFAIVEAEMSTKPSAPLCSRSGDSGALVSENGTDAASLMMHSPESPHSRCARRLWQALSGFRENIESHRLPQESVLPALTLLAPFAGSAGARGARQGAVPQHYLAGDGDEPRLRRGGV